MSTMTLRYDRRKRNEHKAARARAIKAQERADLIQTVKADAMKLAAGNSAFKSKWRIENVTGMRYEEMTIKQKIEVLENVIKVYRELGSRLMKEYDVKKLDTLEDRIATAAGEIIRLSILEVDQAFEARDPDKVEDQSALRNPGTNQ